MRHSYHLPSYKKYMGARTTALCESGAVIFIYSGKICLTRHHSGAIIKAYGALAQLGVRHIRIVKVRGSIPLCSTKLREIEHLDDDLVFLREGCRGSVQNSQIIAFVDAERARKVVTPSGLFPCVQRAAVSSWAVFQLSAASALICCAAVAAIEVATLAAVAVTAVVSAAPAFFASRQACSILVAIQTSTSP